MRKLGWAAVVVVVVALAVTAMAYAPARTAPGPVQVAQGPGGGGPGGQMSEADRAALSLPAKGILNLGNPQIAQISQRL